MAIGRCHLVVLICVSSARAISTNKPSDSARTYDSTKPVRFHEDVTRNRYQEANDDRTKLTGERDSQQSSSSYSDGYGLYGPAEESGGHYGSPYHQGPYYDDRGSADHFQGRPYSPYPIAPIYGPDKYALALKGILLPLVGVALLSAAGALAYNPVLLQLGVISGIRRRRRRSAPGQGPYSFAET